MVCSIKSTTVNYEVFLLISLGQKERQLTVKRNFRVITNVHLHLPFFVLFFLNGILFVWFMSNNFSFTALISVCRMLGWVDTLPGQILVNLNQIIGHNYKLKPDSHKLGNTMELASDEENYQRKFRYDKWHLMNYCYHVLIRTNI